MGVDCNIILSPGTRVGDVAKVVGALVGLKPEKKFFGSGDDGWATRVEGVTVGRPKAEIPECAEILVSDPAAHLTRLLYHFEGGKKGERLIILRSRARNLALGRRLVQFFGGRLISEDTCDTEILEVEPLADIHAEGGDEWYSLQERLLAVTPLTEEEIEAMEEHAAYKKGE
jgi:hypothetical protein